ncbi:probable potassium transporter 14 isoform X2 [Panicum virgatum]|uniref:probable potassium transporter 14 isoform X2 n=1 Tax=Panicum virgatum TaxID=38727 RepID=UPI0019D5E953|nr:probable potassium transporter 14 isoform X2 [Panicum virgatum]
MESGSGGGRRLRKTESAEMRWVVPGGACEEDEIESSDDGGADTPAAASGSRGGGGSDDDDDGYEEDEMLRQRLVRTGPRADSFDVEALDVPGVYRHQEFTMGRSIVLTLQTLGVVFGDVGTSPLYTFDVMFNKYPITAKEDVLGALSLVIYTLILIPFLKYTLIVLWGNDDGEGGTFALYSLICRNAKASLLPNQLPSDTRISSFNLKVPSVELERSLKIKERLETSSMLKKLLLMLVLFGTSMAIADGVVTPAMSVMSAVNGLKVGISSVNEGEVVMITVAFLIVLFSLQRFGTSKVGLAVGPALFIWFCCLAGIGIYNIRIYGSQVLHAFNPLYIYYYFERNPTKAWMSLGGCLLCATGSEAMFADLCYFSVRSVQLTFVFLVLPCLLLGYLGQAAFLMENLTQSQQVFFLSIPSQAFWPVVFIATLAALIASRAMATAIFSTIKQATALGCFPRLKIIHTSRKFMGQIYIPVMNWFLLVSCLAFVTVFGSINEIGNAYGIAELGVMMMTTVLVTIIMLLIWQVWVQGCTQGEPASV